MLDEPRIVWKDGVKYVLDDTASDPLGHILREIRDIKREQKATRLLVQDALERLRALAEQI